ncbi:Bacterial extracellular solute-binding protein, family 5 [Candidatus Magnetomorum sp. HK-1]|nr:Bacterial extracellular solute-binding protein, family 5 [Candidatus Magnetomorum sp. HK-1]
MHTGKQILFIITLMFIYSCGDSISSEDRAKRAALSKKDIYIGVVDSSINSSLFVEGVNMAIDEINKQGGIIGKKIHPIFYDDKRNLKIGHDIAKKLSSNPDIVAVVGHRYSSIAIPVSIIYENNGILFISTGASNPNFTQYGGMFTFRNMVSGIDIGKEIARFAHQKEYKKIVAIYQRESSNQRLSDIFCEEADKLGIDIVAVRSYFTWQNDYKDIIAELAKNYEFDAVFLGGLLPFAGELIKQARAMFKKVAFIGSHNLDSLELFSVAGKSAEHIIVPTIFNPDLPIKSTRDFVKKFQIMFGLVPDTWAALGYDAIQLLAHAIDKNGSTVPIVMSSTLRFLENWNGVTGSYSFDQKGDITRKKIFFKELINGKFQFLNYAMEEKINPFYVMEETTLRLPIAGNINIIDPGYSNDTFSIELIEQMFIGLTDFNPKTYEATPELAKSWNVSDDGKTYIFKLRQDAKWTNGKPVTAHDIVWAIHRHIKPNSKCPSVSMLYVIKNASKINNGKIKDISKIGVRALDDFTIEFELENSASYFPGMAGLPIYRPLPSETIEKYKKAWTEPENIQTNGSYNLVYWDKSLLMILKKNPNYYDEKKVAIPEIRYNTIHNSAVGLVMFENNELDIIGGNFLQIPFKQLNEIQVNPKLSDQYSKKPMFSTYAYGFNTKLPPMDNPLVRKAICAAVDRQFLIELVTKSDATPATTYTPPPILGSVDPKDGIGIGFNPLKAKQWLAKAGYPDGKNFPTIDLLYNSSNFHSNIAKAVQASLAYYLNIKIRLCEEKWENYIKYMFNPEAASHHIFKFGWSVDYPDANNVLNELFNSNNPINITCWKNTEFDNLMTKALEIIDTQKRKIFYKRAEKILCEEQAVIFPLFFESAYYLVNSRIKDWYHMAIGGQHIRNWQIENKY